MARYNNLSLLRQLLRARRLAGSGVLPAELSVTIRPAYPDDAAAVERLAALDECRLPTGFVMVAEVDGDLWAAVSIEDGHGVADPFRPSGELLLTLQQRADRLRRASYRPSAVPQTSAERQRPRHAAAASEHRAGLRGAGGPSI